MKILETEHLVLREIVESDDEFMLDILNQPSFIKYIGDRNVRTVEAAREYIENRFAESYKKFGFGMWTVELKNDGTPVGICGFVKRDTLPDADIGFAFLPQFEGKGYALESAVGAMKYGRDVLHLPHVLAITTKDNESSGRLLGKLGFEFERLIVQNDEELKLYSHSAA